MTRRNPHLGPKPAIGPATSACPAAEALDRFLDSEVSDAEAALIAEHLSVCDRCRRRLESEPTQAAWTEELRCAGQEIAETCVDVNVPLAQLKTVLTDYEIIEEIGRGGMGVVYRARQTALNRIVALKILPALLSAVRPDAAARFRREAELAGRLKHNNITAVHDFGEIDGTLYYAMELIEGRSLRDTLREIEVSGAIDVVLGAFSDEPSAPTSGDQSHLWVRHPASQVTRLGSSARTDRSYYRCVARWFADLAEALHYAHGQGVIHRDIKPSNLLLNVDGRLMISDFGLARASSADTLTVGPSLLGTARYMSPEQIDETADPIDGRVDVYGLGATLYELLAFRPMFAAADDREVLNQVLNREPTPPHRFVRQVPRELETICLKAVEKDRTTRYATAKAMADDLNRWLLDLPIHAKRPSLPTRVGKFVRRRKVSSALAVVSTTLLITTGLIYAAYSASHREAVKVKSLATNRQAALLCREAREELLAGNPIVALEKADAGLAEDAASVELRRIRARILHYLGRDDEALAIMESVLGRNPDDWETHYTMTFLLQGNVASPLLRYAAPASLLTTVSPDERERRLAHHREQVQRLAPESAEALYLAAQAQTDPHRAIELLDEALDRQPALSEALLARSRRFHQIGDYEAMLLDAERGIARHPGWGLFHGQLALALGELGRQKEAELAYGDAIERDPDYAAWWHNRGVAKCRLGRFAAALADANAAIRLDPEFAYAHVGRARAQAGLGRLDLALVDFNLALKLRPGDIEILHERGKMHFDAGHLEDAIADMARVIEIAPGDARAYGSRAVAFIIMEKFGRAIGDLTRCIQLDPKNAKAYRNRGHAHAINKQYAESIADYTEAMEIEPGVAGDLSSRASLFFHLGRYEDAIADLTRLIEIKASPAVLMQRGMAYESSGAERLALADYEGVSKADGRTGAYGRLWRYILLRDMGQETAAAGAILKRDANQDARDDWTDRLFDLFTGDLTPDGLLAAAVTDDERAEAYYYIARKALLDGKPDAAKESFAKCVALGRSAVMETDFARALLKQSDGPVAIRAGGAPTSSTHRDGPDG